jgi:hypothetical protein
MGPFGKYAAQLAELGLSPLPVGGPDGKMPLLKRYTNGLVSIANASSFALRFGSANIALLTGLSGLTVVDVDEPGLASQMERRFGSTSLVVRSGGRGGTHLYYGSTEGLNPTDLRDSEGIPVEVKAAKTIVVVPPSVHPETGRRYEFIEGAFDRATLDALPPFRFEALRMGRTVDDVRRILKGERNNWLFLQCMRAAHFCDAFEDLFDYAQSRNEECEPHLDDAEVRKIAVSAWGYTTRGLNWVGSTGRVILTENEIDDLARLFPGNEIAALLKLRIEHSARLARGEPFAFATLAMARDKVLPDWTRHDYRAAAQRLESAGLLRRVAQGRHGVPVQYVLVPIPTRKPDE